MVDLCLARDAGDTSRPVRISQRLLEQREAYYSELSQAQHGDLTVTAWMVWFVAQVHTAWETASGVRSTRYYINLPGWVPETA